MAEDGLIYLIYRELFKKAYYHQRKMDRRLEGNTQKKCKRPKTCTMMDLTSNQINASKTKDVNPQLYLK